MLAPRQRRLTKYVEDDYYYYFINRIQFDRWFFMYTKIVWRCRIFPSIFLSNFVHPHKHIHNWHILYLINLEKMVVAEVQCLQKMRHPNIIAYHGAWNEGSRAYILMEYASRGTLKDLLERRKKPLKKEVRRCLLSFFFQFWQIPIMHFVLTHRRMLFTCFLKWPWASTTFTPTKYFTVI